MAKHNIYLVGFMGTGKSTIGRELARVMGRKCIDVDQELEKIHGCTVSEMFTNYGEEWFREKEYQLCKELSESTNKVVATGGGTLFNGDIFELFKSSGLLICLYTEKDRLIERLERANPLKRPLLQNTDIPQKVDSLLEKRQWLYDKIKIRIDTTNYTPMETARKIAELLKKRQLILNRLMDQYIDLT